MAVVEERSWSTCIPRQNGSPATQSAVIVDHPETADQSDVRVVDTIAQRRSRKLTDGISHSQESARGPCLPHGQLPARGVVRKSAAHSERMIADELRAFALGAEAEVFKLHEADNGIVIVSLEEIHVLMSDTRMRKELVAIQSPATAHLNRVLGE